MYISYSISMPKSFCQHLSLRGQFNHFNSAINYYLIDILQYFRPQNRCFKKVE